MNEQNYWENRFSSKNWEQCSGREQTRYFGELLLKHLPQWIKNEWRQKAYSICDMGCAEGECAELLAEQFPSSKIYGSDFSRSALDLGRTRYPSVHFVQDDIYTSNAQYDVIITSNVLEHLEQPDQILRRLLRNASKYLVIMVPLDDDLQIAEHINCFSFHSFRDQYEGAKLCYHEWIYCNDPLWPGYQLILVYATGGDVPNSCALNEMTGNVWEKAAFVQFEQERKLQLAKEKEQWDSHMQHIQYLKSQNELAQQKVQELENQNTMLQQQLQKAKPEGNEKDIIIQEQLFAIEGNIAEFETLLNRRVLRIFMRVYGFLAEFTHSSCKGKLQILKKLFLRPFGVSQNIHVNSNCSFLGEAAKLISQERQCIENIQAELQSSSTSTSLSTKNRIDIFSIISAAKRSHKKIVCIMAPMFTESRLKDGYYRRIKAIDDILGKKTLKIYMCHDCTQEEQKYAPIINVVDEEHIRLHYLPWIKENREFISEVADCADIVYHHGVGFMDEDIIRKKHLLKIVDLHGALPEEFAMSGNYPMVQKETLHEELAMRYADCLISVTESMVSHMEEKYRGQYHQKYILLPILDQGTLESKIECTARKTDTGTPSVVYAGGMQKWQMIEEMQACMRKQPDYEYRIFTADPNGFWDLWGDKPSLRHMKVESATPEQLRVEYEKCQYGFVLREDCIVNNVACPTKLVEYILKGIVPILNTPHVGDFVSDGMQYISIENFCNGILPDEETRVQMARSNRKVIDQIIEKYETGVKELRGMVQGDLQ